jgi:DNA mismatch repair protein PMS2
VSQKGAPGDRGTTIIIKDLFLNLPVRRTDFLKNIKREYNKLIEALTGYALVCSAIKFIVFQVDKKGFAAFRLFELFLCLRLTSKTLVQCQE